MRPPSLPYRIKSTPMLCCPEFTMNQAAPPESTPTPTARDPSPPALPTTDPSPSPKYRHLDILEIAAHSEPKSTSTISSTMVNTRCVLWNPKISTSWHRGDTAVITPRANFNLLQPRIVQRGKNPPACRLRVEPAHHAPCQIRNQCREHDARFPSGPRLLARRPGLFVPV